MTNKTIFELDVAGTVADTDLVPIWQTTNASGPAKKIQIAQLRAAVSNTVTWANVTGDPMTNVEYKADWDAVQAQIAALTSQVALASKILQHGLAGGTATVSITFPPGYNSTNSLLFLAGRSAVAGGSGNGINNISFTPTVTATGWNVACYCKSEAGNITYPYFSYFIVSTTVTPTVYDGSAGGGTPPQEGGGGGSGNLPV